MANTHYLKEQNEKKKLKEKTIQNKSTLMLALCNNRKVMVGSRYIYIIAKCFREIFSKTKKKLQIKCVFIWIC